MTTQSASTNSASNDISPANRASKRIALIVHSVKLAPFEPGLDRAAYIASMLAGSGYCVDLITSSFQHWQKSHRDITDPIYQSLPFNVTFIDEPGYKKNIDPLRILSHHVFNKRLRHHLSEQSGRYDAIWAQIPPNNISATASAFAQAENIPFIVDVNDLWPEAMRMVIDVPVISDIAFAPMAKDALRTFKGAWGVIGTSNEYASHGEKYAEIPKDRQLTVYVGNDLDRFDKGAAKNPVDKHDDEIWVTYAGTLGKSYDLSTLIDAVALANANMSRHQQNDELHSALRLKILGDGPDKAALMDQASKKCPDLVEFLGYVEYEKMAGYLYASDIVVNSLVENAPQSIVSKIGDYLASGTPMINTGTSQEMINLVDGEGIGISVAPNNVQALSQCICKLSEDESARSQMGQCAREMACDKFDRKHSYQKIISFIDEAVFGS